MCSLVQSSLTAAEEQMVQRIPIYCAYTGQSLIAALPEVTQSKLLSTVSVEWHVPAIQVGVFSACIIQLYQFNHHHPLAPAASI